MPYEEVFFFLGPAQVVNVLVPVLKYPIKVAVSLSATKAVVLK